MAWPFTFLSRLAGGRKQKKATRIKRRPLAFRFGVEELEPRILLTRGIFTVPGLPSQTVRATFLWDPSEAGLPNEMGMFRVDNANGRIGNFKPGDAAYAQAALSQ